MNTNTTRHHFPVESPPKLLITRFISETLTVPTIRVTLQEQYQRKLRNTYTGFMIGNHYTFYSSSLKLFLQRLGTHHKKYLRLVYSWDRNYWYVRLVPRVNWGTIIYYVYAPNRESSKPTSWDIKKHNRRKRAYGQFDSWRLCAIKITSSLNIQQISYFTSFPIQQFINYVSTTVCY
jgi:hypothetical protein